MFFLRDLILSFLLVLQIGITFLILYFIKGLVFIGEVTNSGIKYVYKGALRHLKAIKYVLKYIFTNISSSIRNIFSRIKSIPRKSIRASVLLYKNLRDYFTRAILGIARSWSSLASYVGLLANNLKLYPNRLWKSVVLMLKSLWKIFPKVSIKVHIPHIPLATKPVHHSRVRHFRYFVMLILAIGITTISYFSYNFYVSLPRPQDIGRLNYSLTSHVFDRNGKKLYDFYKDQNRTPISIKDLPKHVYLATIAIEDKDFYKHNGVAPISGIARAFRDWIIRKRGIQGGSTITQQLVKTALLSPERTITRKIKEIIIALETERIFSKEKILEMYLNQVPYGGAVYGIEEASVRYFGKNSKNLTLSEAALLAGLPQAPSDYSPFSNMKAAIERRNQVLLAMLEQGYITRSQYTISSRENLSFSKDSISISAPHFVFYVRKYLEEYLDGEEMDRKGYRISTSLDLEVQNKVEKILNEELEKVSYLNVTNGAVLVTKPATGEVIAMVGSRDFFNGTSGEFNVTTGLRQPGSSIKPILYALAMQKGVTPASIIDDSPTVFRIGPTEIYKPVNYDGRFHGRVTLRLALANSYNIPAVKMMDSVGVIDFLDFAKDAGIDTWKDPSNYGLSLALGGGEVTMVDMAESYSMLANSGRRSDVNPILNIIDKDGQILKQGDVENREVIPQNIAYIISDILADNNARASAFGVRSALEIPGYKVAVKTGTTDEKRDNWTIGYTPDYMVVVWVGNNDHTPMNPYLTSGITGAAPIWNKVMTYLLSEYSQGQKNWYTKPTTIVEKTCLGRPEIFVSGTENSVSCIIPTPATKTADNKEKSP